MQLALAPRGGARAVLAHLVGSGLDDDRYVIQRYQAAERNADGTFHRRRHQGNLLALGAVGGEWSLRSGGFALPALILLPLLRRLRGGADADLFDVAALPPLVAPMLGLPAVEIRGNAAVHDPVAKLEVILVRGPAGRHDWPTATP